QSFINRSQILLIAGAILSPVLHGANVPAVADTYVTSSAPAANFGASNLIAAPGNTVLIQFDVSSIPAGSSLAAAYLPLYVDKITAAGSASFSQITSPWGENTATFVTIPTISAPFAAASVSVANTFLSVDVTALVNGWLSSPATNFGIAITGVGAASFQLDS